MRDNGCCLCDQFAGRAAGDLLHRHLGGTYEERLRRIEGGFALLPSVGALVPGHLLLCPEQHLRSFREPGASQLADVERRVDEVAAALTRATGRRVSCFEHGDAPGVSRVSCSVSHAHLHLVPAGKSLINGAQQLAEWMQIESLADLPSTIGEHEYLMLKEADLLLVAKAPEAGHPSQLLRRLVADSVGTPEAWNWREHPNHLLTRASWDLTQKLKLAA